MTVVQVLIGLATLVVNAFFVGAEFAVISAKRSQIEPRAEEGSRAARITLFAMEHATLMLATTQLGITVCSLVLGAVGEPAVSHLLEPVLHAVHVPESFLHPIAFVVGLAIVVYLHVVLGEMIPKNLALAGPDRAALALGPPIWFIVKLLRPVIDRTTTNCCGLPLAVRLAVLPAQAGPVRLPSPTAAAGRPLHHSIRHGPAP